MEMTIELSALLIFVVGGGFAILALVIKSNIHKETAPIRQDVVEIRAMLSAQKEWTESMDNDRLERNAERLGDAAGKACAEAINRHLKRP